MYELTQSEKLAILHRRKPSYAIIKDGDIDLGTSSYSRIEVKNPRGHYVCWCTGNNGDKLSDSICLHCGRQISTSFPATSKEMITKLKLFWEKSGKTKWYAASNQNVVSLGNFFYVKKHPEKDNGILIFKINLSVKAGKDTIEDEELVWKIAHTIEILPGEKSRAFKTVRGQEVEIDLFDAMQLSSKSIKESPDILFENAVGPIDFMLKHKKCSQYTGFMECFNLVDTNMPRGSFFLFYLYIYAQYPAVEFIVKMGHVSLLAKIMRKLSNGCNKEEIRNEAKMLRRVINPEATNGSSAMTSPKYIADDLSQKSANVEEYILWGDICQISPGGVSKDNYLKWTRTKVYNAIRNYGSDLPNIIKYGYTVGDIVNYVSKQYLSHNDNNESHAFAYGRGYTHYFVLFKDYLNMCDIMSIAPDKFPSDIVTVHDNMSKAFSAMKNAMADQSIRVLAERAEKYLPDTKEYHDSKYIICLPKSSYDIVQEGQNMHNCVGSYINKIAGHRSLVFFIRLKDEQDHSYVTAEYTGGKLRQLYYKNNRHVTEKEIFDIANAFCEKLYNSHQFMF